MVLVICILIGLSLIILVNSHKNDESFGVLTMDTMVSVNIYDVTENVFLKSEKEVKNFYDKMHKLTDRFNTYDDINNVYTINENAGIKPVVVDELLYNIIKTSVEVNKIYPAFDITMGKVSDVYVDLFNKGENTPPLNSDVNIAMNNIGMDHIELNDENMSVYVNQPGIEIDLGGVAKGFSTEIVAQYFENKGLNAIINAGGNVRTVGKKPTGEDWLVGLEDPNAGGFYSNTYGYLELSGSNGIVSSGDYQRYFEHDGKRYHHILNPDTGLPVDSEFRAVSVIGPNSFVSDILSTILFVVPYEEGLKIVDELDVEAIWFFNENDVRHTNIEIINCYEESNNDLCVGE